MRVVVTGHLGFVGKHLCRALVDQGDDVVGLDRKDGHDVLSCDLPDADRVYHLAAQTDAQSQDVVGDAETNISGTLRLLEEYGDRLAFASSSMVNYPLSPYAISKRAAEEYARFYGAAIVRFCNLFGPGGHSVIDKFAGADCMTIYGSGEQLRTYAPVSDAVKALLRAEPAELHILKGRNLTVNDIAEMFPGKAIERMPARPLDVMDGRQIIF